MKKTGLSQNMFLEIIRQYIHGAGMFCLVLSIVNFLCIPLCHASTAARYGKLSSHIKHLVLEYENQKNVSQSKEMHGRSLNYVCALVKSNDKTVFEKCGCKVLDCIGDIYIAKIPISNILTLSSYPQVARIEADATASPTLDVSALQTNASVLWNLPNKDLPACNTPYTGSGVVVGLADLGFDLTHPTFRDGDTGECRIRTFWDQIVFEDDGIGNEMEVGREYNTPEKILAKRYSADSGLVEHGSHTAGIAAGSGLGSAHNASGFGYKYSGMAPKSDICLVSCAATNNQSLIPEEKRNLYTSALTALSFKYIFDYAETHRQPCVISYSLGAVGGFYNEHELLKQALDKLQGPGRIFVGSVGNESSRNSYLKKEADQPDMTTFLTSPRNKDAFVFVVSDIMPDEFHDATQYEMTIYPQQGEAFRRSITAREVSLCKDSLLNETVKVGDIEFDVNACVYPSCYDESKCVCEFDVCQKEASKPTDNGFCISLTVKNADNDTRSNSVEMYAVNCSLSHNNLDIKSQNGEKSHNVLYPGALENVIGVGALYSKASFVNSKGNTIAYNHGSIGHNANFSGIGPSFNGTCKPDIVAPGCNIISAGNSAYQMANPEKVLNDNYTISVFDYGNGKPGEQSSYRWFACDGTSMATPMVAGIVALWLEACPTLTREQVVETLSHSASHPDDTLNYPNNVYGYGVIDAVAGIDYILKHFAKEETGIRETYPNTMVSGSNKAIYNALGQIVKKPVKGHVYIQNGRKICW